MNSAPDWTLKQLRNHRIIMFKKAFQNNSADYLILRQKKLGDVLPRSFFSRAKFEFVYGVYE